VFTLNDELGRCVVHTVHTMAEETKCKQICVSLVRTGKGDPKIWTPNLGQIERAREPSRTGTIIRLQSIFVFSPTTKKRDFDEREKFE